MNLNINFYNHVYLNFFIFVSEVNLSQKKNAPIINFKGDGQLDIGDTFERSKWKIYSTH